MILKILVISLTSLIVFPFAVSAGKINYTISVACTHSMEPEITCNDALIVNTVSLDEDIIPGRIYVYRPRFWSVFGEVRYANIIHRFDHKIEENYGTDYYFKGDNSSFIDPAVRRNQIFLKVIDIKENYFIKASEKFAGVS